MWKVSWFYEKVYNIANFGDYAAILYHIILPTPLLSCKSSHNKKCKKHFHDFNLLKTLQRL